MEFTEGHALIIGIDHYADSFLQNALPIQNGTPLPLADARGAAVALQDPQGCAYPQGHVTLLSGAQATKQGIVTALEKLASQTDKDATILVYFCGHGGLGLDGKYYLAASDAQIVEYGFEQNTLLGEIELLDLSSQIRAQHLVLILNSSFPTADPTSPFAPPPSIFIARFLNTGPGRVVITAAGPKEFSNFVGGQPNTIFGSALIDALRGDTVPRGKFIKLDDLYQALYANVKHVAATLNVVQEPALIATAELKPFPLAMYQAGKFGNMRGGLPAFDLSQGAIKLFSVFDLDVLIKPTTKGSIPSGSNPGNTDSGIDFGSIGDGKGLGTLGDTASIGDLLGGIIGTGSSGGGKTTGGINIGGGTVSVGGDMVGGDKIVTGDTVGGDKVDGDKFGDGSIKIESLVIHTGDDAKPRKLIAEAIRLDVSPPKQVYVEQSFTIGIAVSRPDSPPIKIDEHSQIFSESGEIFRAEDEDVINYRVEIFAPDFQVVKSELVFRLKKGENSPIKKFYLTAKKAGQLPVIVYAYQEKYEIASTQITIEASVQVKPNP